MTKVYTEPVPTTFSKDQVAGYESFSSQEYYRLAYEIAGDIIGGEYGIHKLEDYDLVWSPSGKTCSEHLFSLQTKSGDELYGTLFSSHYCGRLNAAGNIDNSLTVGCRKHWYLLFEEKTTAWTRECCIVGYVRTLIQVGGWFILSELWEMATYG